MELGLFFKKNKKNTTLIRELRVRSYCPNIYTVISGKSANGKNQKYEMILEIETLTREDLESKMFLIKDYREYNSKEDKFQVMVVPKSRRNRSLDYETR